MFIDKTKFKKAVNTAYKKEGLTVSNDGDGIIICGGGRMGDLDERKQTAENDQSHTD